MVLDTVRTFEEGGRHTSHLTMDRIGIANVAKVTLRRRAAAPPAGTFSERIRHEHDGPNGHYVRETSLCK